MAVPKKRESHPFCPNTAAASERHCSADLRENLNANNELLNHSVKLAEVKSPEHSGGDFRNSR